MLIVTAALVYHTRRIHLVLHGIAHVAFLVFRFSINICDKLEKLTAFLFFLINHEFLHKAWNFTFLRFSPTHVDIPSFIIELGVLLLDPQESLKLIRLLYSRDHHQILQVALQDISAVIYHIWHWTTSRSWASRISFYLVKTFICKLVRTLRELNAWILIDQRFVKDAECFVLLCYHPSFLIVERNLDAVLGVGSVIEGVFNHDGILYLAVDTHLEEVWPAKVIHVFWASLDMLQENLCGVERVAKLALRCHTVLETFWEGFELLVLAMQLIILCLLFGNGFA